MNDYPIHTNPGDLVLDAPMGSGTTADACIDTDHIHRLRMQSRLLPSAEKCISSHRQSKNQTL
jgi:hypothetical protein